MITFETTSGSVYEVDVADRAARRVSGLHDPTPRQGSGGWRHYQSLDFIVNGPEVRVFYDWDGKGHGTITGPVMNPEKLKADLLIQGANIRFTWNLEVESSSPS